MSKPNLWFFDLDGTLIDSEPAIRACFKKTLSRISPNLLNRVDEVIIGPPLSITASQLLKTNDKNLINHFCDLFKTEYDSNCHALTPLYPDCADVLKTLKSRGDTLILATNKRLKPTLSILKHHQLEDLFQAIDCADQFDGQSKSLFINQRLSSLNLSKYHKLIMVGDTSADFDASKKNDMTFIWAKYGYEPSLIFPKEECIQIIDSLIELKNIC